MPVHSSSLGLKWWWLQVFLEAFHQTAGLGIIGCCVVQLSAKQLGHYWPQLLRWVPCPSNDIMVRMLKWTIQQKIRACVQARVKISKRERASGHHVNLSVMAKRWVVLLEGCSGSVWLIWMWRKDWFLSSKFCSGALMWCRDMVELQPMQDLAKLATLHKLQFLFSRCEQWWGQTCICICKCTKWDACICIWNIFKLHICICNWTCTCCICFKYSPATASCRFLVIAKWWKIIHMLPWLKIKPYFSSRKSRGLPRG